MLNIIKAQDQLKDLSDQQLGGVMQSGTVPGYLVLAEQQRRKKMRTEAANQGVQPPTTTVAEDIAQPSPMSQGVASLPVQAPSFASGGIVSFAGGGTIKEDMELSDEEVLAMSQADRDAWIRRMEAATEEAKGRNSINQTPPDSHTFETPSTPSTGIIELPQAQEYVRPPAEVAADFQDKGEDPSVVIPMPKEKHDAYMKRLADETAKTSAETAAMREASAAPAGISSLPQVPQVPQDMSRRPEDYMTPEQLAAHQRAQQYAYGTEGYKGESTPAQKEASYVPQPESKMRAPIVIEDQYPGGQAEVQGISALPQAPQPKEVDRESFKRPAPIKGSLGRPASMVVPQEDNYAELQRSPELLPQISVGAPQSKAQSQALSTPKPTAKAAPKPAPVEEDDMTKGIAALKKHMHVDEPVYKNDEAKRTSSELKERTQKLEDNNLSMALMQVSASMLSSKSTNFGRMLGEGLSGGLQAYATGQKNIRDLQKEIGALDAGIEAALNERDMKSYNNKVAEKTALVTVYTEAKKTADNIKSNEGIATLQSGDNRYNTDTRSSDSREHNKTLERIANARNLIDKTHSNEIKEQNLELKKQNQLATLIGTRDKLAEKIADRTQFNDDAARAEAIKTLANMDKIIKRNMAEIYPDLAEKTFDRSKVERLPD